MNECPECGSELQFEPGSPGHIDEPGSEDTYYCPECDYSETVSKHERLANQADDIFDRWREGLWELSEAD